MPNDLRAEEDAWIRAAQQGDADAFGLLFRRYHERTVRTLFAMMGSEFEAREAAQEAWVKAWKRIDSYDYTSSFYTWLHRISINTALDAIRVRKRNNHRAATVESIDESPSHEANPAQRAIHRERWDELQTALAQLPEEQRSALVLRELSGYSYQEIADTLSIKPGTVMSRLHAARQKLAAIWKKSS
ncbi:RNA polymerase sigma factor [Cerasicoccus arenae]|uniref:RNA polymerase sigma factor n=1 Tax=Cerasicoccus arenae TaxID=424488 RepID=A0A8J3DJ33_9BACT|nr:sigma-70 family RNA polymerase sigma factor [Cerasicoccus arenae]MBK1856677.1 sigma-70 family RNA polymerase sigma factor [Cerasicoccus arenae]GHB98854.1 RNA polymerase sigma factor [Cerasicoccus arenae]